MKKKKKSDLKGVAPLDEVDDRVRRVASFIALSRDDDATISATKSSFSVDDDEARALVLKARQWLGEVADVDTRQELGTRRKQLEDLLDRVRRVGDVKTELDTLKELSKLARLYDAASVFNVTSNQEPLTIALTREHLEGLALCEKGLPVEELARRVAISVINGERLRGEEGASATSKRRAVASGSRRRAASGGRKRAATSRGAGKP